jgi:phenylacetate-CoA ligase
MKFRLQDYSSPFTIWRFHRLMARAPFWEPSRLDAWARAQRSAVVRHAFESVPYYRKSLTEAGIRLDRLVDNDEWLRLPRIDKKLIQANSEEICSTTGNAGAIWARTSGSTGMPLRILLDRNVNAAAFALFWRAWSTGGYWRLGQRHAVLKGPLESGVWRINRRIRALEIVSARISEQTVDEVAQTLRDYRPKFMRGYPSAMYLLCRLLEDRGQRVHIPMVISGSETLSDYHRAKIEAVLGARVINHYTHWERAGSILECEVGAMHAQEDYGHHELLDAQGKPVGPGEEGEITVTGLHNRAMPLIRYRTGDMGVWGSGTCRCGRTFPVIERISGRAVDMLIRQDGVTVPGRAVTNVIARELKDVRYIQMVQKSVGVLTIKVVPSANFSDDTTQGIVRDLHGLFDNQMEVHIELSAVEDLIRNPQGKLREYINLMSDEERIAAKSRQPGPAATHHARG